MGLIKKMGGGSRRMVAKQQGGQFRSTINNCTKFNRRVPETEGTCGAIKMLNANRRKKIISQYALNCA